MMHPLRLKDKVAIITGSARGIGQAIAVVYAREGARIVLADILECEETLRMIEEVNGEGVPIRADVRKASDDAKMVKLAVESFGGLDILVNNAGIDSKGPILECTEEEWDDNLDINLKGAFLCSKYAIPQMIRNGKGNIIMIASQEALRPGKTAAYAASKAGMVNLGRSIALHYARYNIRCNSICPGPVDTEMMRHYCKISPLGEQVARRSSELRTPLRRWAHPEEIAYAAVYLGSDDSMFVTGTELVIDGGDSAVMATYPPWEKENPVAEWGIAPLKWHPKLDRSGSTANRSQ